VRVLFAEDEQEIREAVITLLGKFGHTVVAVDKAEDLLVELGRNTFDLILTDNDTGSDMRGLDVARKIRTDPFYKEIQDIPVIIQSGSAIEAETLKLNALFLLKPWGRLQLKMALDEAVLRQAGSPIR